MLPFLKNKDEASANAEEETINRKPDGEEEFEMLDAVVEDLMAAFEKKDKALLKSALEGLCDHIMSMDEVQDEGMGP